MLRTLHIHDVGPAPRMDFEFAPRLNVLTGDNGLGKSFVLDVIWYALTWTWAGAAAWPAQQAGRDGSYLTSSITYTFEDDHWGTRTYRSRFHAPRQEWEGEQLAGPNEIVARLQPDGGIRHEQQVFPGDGVVLYARVDGGYSVWDAYRNGGRHEHFPGAGDARPRSYHISREELWDGPAGAGARPFNGLVYDWVRWQQSKKEPWALLTEVLAELGGEGVEALTAGEPMRVSVGDTRDIPTLRLPYGVVPVTLASSGMRRIAGLAYMIVWAWYENKLAADLLRVAPASSIYLLMDEVETHLHPAWQRRVLPALMRVVRRLNMNIDVQVFASTHAPLVLASVEPTFDEALDDLHHFELEGPRVTATEIPFAKQGDVVNWLVSDTFGGTHPRSIESQKAIEAALAFMDGNQVATAALLEGLKVPAGQRRTKKAQQDCIHALLRQHLPDHDDFWPTWLVSSGRLPRTKVDSKA